MVHRRMTSCGSQSGGLLLAYLHVSEAQPDGMWFNLLAHLLQLIVPLFALGLEHSCETLLLGHRSIVHLCQTSSGGGLRSSLGYFLARVVLGAHRHLAIYVSLRSPGAFLCAWFSYGDNRCRTRDDRGIIVIFCGRVRINAMKSIH